MRFAIVIAYLFAACLVQSSDAFWFAKTWSAYQAYQAGDVEQAKQLFVDAVITDQQDWRALFNLGTIALNQEQYDDAVCHFEKTIVLNPDHEESRRRLEIAKKMRDQKKQEEQKKNQDQEKKEKENQEKDKNNKPSCAEAPAGKQNGQQEQQKQQQENKNEQENKKNSESGKKQACPPESAKSDMSAGALAKAEDVDRRRREIFTQLDKFDQQMQKQMMQVAIAQSDAQQNGQYENNW